jgi:hypothetical protein
MFRGHRVSKHQCISIKTHAFQLQQTAIFNNLQITLCSNTIKTITQTVTEKRNSTGWVTDMKLLRSNEVEIKRTDKNEFQMC